MAIYDYVDDPVASGAKAFGEGTPSVLGVGPAGFFCIKRHIDLSVAGDLFTPTGAFGAGDVLGIFNASEGMLIQGVAIEVTTVEANTLAITIGDAADDAAGFLTAGNLNSAVWQHGYTNTTYAGAYCDGTTGSAFHGGKIYTTADTVDITLTTAAADVAVFDVYIYGIDFRPIG